MGKKVRNDASGAFSPDVTEVKDILAGRMRKALSMCPALRMRLRYSSQERNDIVLAFRQAVGKSDVIHYGSNIYVFNGRYYSVLQKDAFDNVIETLCEEHSLVLPLWDMVKKYSWNKAQDMAVPRSAYNRSKLCFRNGVVDFSSPSQDGTYTLLDHSPSHVVFFEMPYAYAPDAGCPLFLKFLARVLPDADTRANLQELCGCIFVDRARYRIERMGVLWGAGGNGKSTFAETLINVIGRGNVSHFDLKDLSTGSERDRNIKHISGKLLNYCTEITSRAINNPNVKSLISMEPQMGRALYSSPETVYDLPLLFGNVNELPRIAGSFRAIARRMAIYPFTVDIPSAEMDVTLADRLRREYPGILNWIMEGLSRLRGNDWLFTRSEQMEKVVRELERGRTAQADTFQMFLEDSRYRPDPAEGDGLPEMIGIGTILRQYSRWASFKGMDAESMSSTLAGRRLTSAGFRKKRASDGSGQVQYMVYGDITRW